MANFNIDYLIVGGGGAGASGFGGVQGGGGGGGGFITSLPGGSGGGSSSESPFTLTTGTQYVVTVGSGAASVYTLTNSQATSGGDSSVFNSFTALGGGSSRSYTSTNTKNSAGRFLYASGGGGTYTGGPGGSGPGSGNAASRGYDGGNGTVGVFYGGGGGGAGGLGSNTVGGAGKLNAITGNTSLSYSGGGGNSWGNPRGGAGQSSQSGGNGFSGVANTGGGGGGGLYNGGNGGDGGSGVVILRYATADVSSYTATGLTPTETTVGTDTVLSFTTVGTGNIAFTAPLPPPPPFDGTKVTTPVTGFNKAGTSEGLKLPSGDNSNQPTGAAAEQGMIRNYTEDSVDGSASAITHYNGTAWQYFTATESPDSPPASPAPTQLDSTIPNFSYSANTAGRPNCRIVSSTTGYSSTKTSTGFTVGKFYCEMKFLSSSGYASGRCGPGVGNNIMNLNSYMGTDANSAGLLTKPEMFLYNGLYTGSPGSGSYGTNGIIMMAFDADTRTFFMGYNGTWSTLTGDPITGAGSVLPADVSPFYWGGWGYNGSDSIEFNFYGSDMAYTIPQGYITA